MAVYTRAGVFSGAVAGVPRETALRVLDAGGADAVLYATAEKTKTVGPVVYANEGGVVTLYADPGTYTLRWTGGSTTVTVTGGTEDPAGAGTQPGLTATLNLLTSGEEVMSRDLMTSEYPCDSGTVFFSYFTARKSESITKIRTFVSGQAASGLTLARVGVYSASGGTLTLVAASASDTTMWTTTFTEYQRALATTFNKVAGNRYAYAFLAVGSTMPILEAIGVRYASMGYAPRMEGDLVSQSDLPASVSESSLANGYRRFQAIFLP